MMSEFQSCDCRQTFIVKEWTITFLHITIDHIFPHRHNIYLSNYA